jgi:hypothetical protein
MNTSEGYTSPKAVASNAVQKPRSAKASPNSKQAMQLVTTLVMSTPRQPPANHEEKEINNEPS